MTEAAPKLQVLVVDDSPVYRKLIEHTLEDGGYSPLLAKNGREALEFFAEHSPAIVITDWMMTDFSGPELCERIRGGQQGPYTYIIVLTSKSEKGNVVEGLAAGADDYLTKPFSPGEFIARLAARLRAAPSELRFELDGLTIDLGAHFVAIDGEEVHLTPIEFSLLRVLATTREPVAPWVLADKVWGPQHGDAAPRARAHIANLRAKLDRGRHRNTIRTEVGVSYRFTRPEWVA